MARPSERMMIAALGVCAVAFVAIALRLWAVQFHSGQDFSPYSSMRTDPLGSKALHDALARLPNLEVRRSFHPIQEIGDGEGRTLFLLGATMSPDRKQDIEAINRFLDTGGRVVIALVRSRRSFSVSEPCCADDSCGRETEAETEDEATPPWRGDIQMITDIWEFEVDLAGQDEAPTSNYIEFDVQSQDYPTLPGTLPWRSAAYFDEMGSDWKPVYAWRNKSGELRSVVIERGWGNGSIVLCSDSFLLSNEAMQHHRHPAFLAWLAGASPTLIFNETHLGVSYYVGVAALARRYRLHGVMLTLMTLALLVIWKNATSLTPRRRPKPIESSAGESPALANLLRRHIRPAQLMRLCLDEWLKGRVAQKAPALSEARMQRIKETVESGAPAHEIYNAVCNILAERTPPIERHE